MCCAHVQKSRGGYTHQTNSLYIAAWYYETVNRRKKLIITISAAVLLVFFVFINQKNKTCEINSGSIISDEAVIIAYEKPAWLEKHTKQCEIETYIHKQYGDIKKDAESVKREFPDTALLPFQIDVEINRITTGIYESILIITHIYTGGAHGNTTYKYYNLKNKNDLSLREYLADIGYDEDGLLQQTNSRLKKDGHDTLENLFIPYEEEKGYLPWRIYQREDGSHGITVIIPPYLVAAYVFGTLVYSF